MPQDYGGAGLGVTEAALMMQTVAESGAGMSGASALHMNIFGLNPVVVFGSDEQKRRAAAAADRRQGQGLLCGDRAECRPRHAEAQDQGGARRRPLFLSGQKIWISTAQVASKMLILARTTPLDQVARRTEGLSLFYTDLDRRYVDVREIPKMGRSAVNSNELFIDELPVPVADRIGEEGRGFEYILHGMNPERILIGAEGIGLGRAAMRKAAAYAKERIVFDRPIGENQAIQHPLAACWMQLEAANLMAFKAASLYDAGEPCGVEANATKYLAGEAAFKACETALMTHGGMGYAKEFHVERYLREVADRADRADHAAPDPELHRREGAGPAEILLALLTLRVVGAVAGWADRG